ncbi:transcription factor Pcc1-domain-containing protein [Aspergillus desertorum]
MSATQLSDTEFPCTLRVLLPFPSHRLASSAMRALEVDAELSPHVRRYFTLKNPNPEDQSADGDEAKTVLETTYKATTNRMLRVAVNGFMESLGVVLGVMEELDVDVLKAEGDE